MRDKVAVPRRLRLHAERDGGRADRDRGQDADGDLNAATSSITTKSPYIARMSMTLPQVSAPMARVGARRTASRRSTRWSPTTAPASTPRRSSRRRSRPAAARSSARCARRCRIRTSAPYIQRVKDAKPDAVFVFLPAGRAGHRLHEGLQRARPRAGRHQADRHRRHHRRPRARRDGRRRARRDHRVPLFGRARLAGEQGVPQGLRGGRRPEAGGRTSWRSAATTAWPRSTR